MRNLRIAVIGRTEMLLEAGRAAERDGHVVGLVATCRPSGHERASEEDFGRLAADHGAAFLRYGDFGQTNISEKLASARCDVAISMNWLTLISRTVRDCFEHGVFNAHPGDLPRYKGNACPNWAILRDEPRVSLTIHRMEDALDSGPVAVKRHLDLDDMTTIAEVYDWLRRAVPEAFCALLTNLAQDRLVLHAQDTAPQAALRCYPRRPEDGLINWDRPAEEIDRLVRASGRPFAGAFTFLEGRERLTVWSTRPLLLAEPFLAIPGQIAYIDAGDPIVACRESYLRLLDVTFDGQDADTSKRRVGESLRNRLF